jgi:hypothetical protein
MINSKSEHEFNLPANNTQKQSNIDNKHIITDLDKKEIITVYEDNSNKLRVSKKNETTSTSLPKLTKISHRKTGSIQMYSKNNFNSSINYYCPCCDHCNTLNDNKYEEYMFSIREAKNIINKAFDYITNNFNSENSFNNIFSENKKDNINNIDDDFEKSMLNYKKLISTNNRQTYIILTHFLDSLVDNKIALNQILTEELMEKVQNSLLSKGNAFEGNNDEVYFDPEIEKLFDGKTKELIKNLYRSNI